jgi:IMP dehydrogenase
VIERLKAEACMREIHLVEEDEIKEHLNNIKLSLELIYQVTLSCELEDVGFDNLFPTEDFLEKDKLALVLQKSVTEEYNVPIITVKQDANYFILDGHHRSFVSKKLMKKTISSLVLQFPETKSYRNPSKRLLEDMGMREFHVIDDPIVRTWAQILTLLKYYEALYDLYFYWKKEEVLLNNLVPTQSQVRRGNLELIDEVVVPILCIRHRDKYYILDGHARSLRALQLGSTSITTMTLVSKLKIEYGIVKTTKKIKLETLNDILLID